jgi:hypothetical protein
LPKEVHTFCLFWWCISSNPGIMEGRVNRNNKMCRYFY